MLSSQLPAAGSSTLLEQRCIQHFVRAQQGPGHPPEGCFKMTASIPGSVGPQYCQPGPHLGAPARPLIRCCNPSGSTAKPTDYPGARPRSNAVWGHGHGDRARGRRSMVDDSEAPARRLGRHNLGVASGMHSWRRIVKAPTLCKTGRGQQTVQKS
ncbi:hypothetical protein BU16DRAFT_138262 [Lophium mytilinum]|uniref:Uncharacterized protein n=1 Tax=Lophium mytilinum TaxID=390894 RepID=A0A6A6QF68_9PEZI|nr:hypothetical protein BU16DRAFT_138262 [Lophium mytilinum]